MQNANAIATAITKEMQFKTVINGIGKKSGKPYTMVTLHDPSTLDNVDFFIREDQHIPLDGLNLKDKVIVSFGMDVIFGRLQPVLQSVVKKV